jgi:hypothetical protein
MPFTDDGIKSSSMKVLTEVHGSCAVYVEEGLAKVGV